MDVGEELDLGSVESIVKLLSRTLSTDMFAIIAATKSNRKISAKHSHICCLLGLEDDLMYESVKNQIKIHLRPYQDAYRDEKFRYDLSHLLPPHPILNYHRMG